MWQFLKQLGHAFCLVGRRFGEDRLMYAASALTYTTLLALVPLMVVGLGVLSAFPVFHSLSADVQQFIFQNFIPTSGQIIQQYLHQFGLQAGKLSLVGTIVLIIMAVMMMLTIERALNDIWKIHRRRQGLSAWLRYWAVLSLAPIFIGVSIAATSYVISLPFIAGTAQVLGVKHLLIGSVPILLTVLAFTLVYIVVPNCHVPLRHALLGAVIATVLFELAKKGFVIYITHFNSYRFIYGAMATIPIFLLWIYFLWVIILFGALFSNVFATHAFTGEIENIDGFTHAFLWLGQLWKAQQQGSGLSIKQLYQGLPANYQISGQSQLLKLEKLKLVERTLGHKYILARDFSKMTLAELYDCLPWKFPDVKNQSILSEKVKKVFQEANQSLSQHLSMPLSELYGELFQD